VYALVAAFLLTVAVGTSAASGPGRPAQPPGGSATSAPGVAGESGGLTWLPRLAADDGAAPPRRWYLLLQRPDCAGLQRAVDSSAGDDRASAADRDLWSALAAVCAAAIDGETDRWEDVEAPTATAEASTTPDPADAVEVCLEGHARDLLEAALQWRQQHPQGQPAVTFPEAGGAPACPSGSSPSSSGG
jgi:hypothetical protein